MKDFFSEYGRVVISALVVTLLLTITVAIKPLATSSCENIVAKLTNYADNKLNNPENNESTWEYEVNGDYVIFTSVPEGATWQDVIDANLRYVWDVPDLDWYDDNATFAESPFDEGLVEFYFYDENEGGMVDGYYIYGYEDEEYYVHVSNEIHLNYEYYRAVD